MMRRRIGPSDGEWPGIFEQLHPDDRPGHLFLEGQPLRWGERALAVVGSRHPTAAGVQMAYELAGGLAEAGFAVVSGLAVGIDTAAHRAALDAGGYTAAVLGCGLDVDYPVRNAALKRRIASTGTLVTEYENAVSPEPFHFPERNRIIAGLCKGVVFVEGSERSGGLITARHALEANRSVFAVPGSTRNPLAAGPNELIRTGQASLVTTVHDILAELAPGLVWGDPLAGEAPMGQPLVNQGEAEILRFLDDVPVPVDRICIDLGLTLGEVALRLAALEVRNYVTKRPGGYTVTDTGARLRARLPPDDGEGSGAS